MSQRGFSLVELSIVLVILGLLVGGVLSGQALIKAAQLQAVTREMREYTTAVNSFIVKYQTAPGDLTNAASYWPSATNGDGDGRIYWSTGESVQAWMQLGLAGLAPGNFSGTGTTLQAGVNAPGSRYNNAVYGLYYVGRAPSDFSPVASTVAINRNMLEILVNNGALNAMTRGVVKSVDAFAIDTKTDDGKPNSGNLLSMVGTYQGTICYSVVSGTYTYMLEASSYSESAKVCNMSLKLN